MRAVDGNRLAHQETMVATKVTWTWKGDSAAVVRRQGSKEYTKPVRSTYLIESFGEVRNMVVKLKKWKE